jgi:hypothetical protein
MKSISLWFTALLFLSSATLGEDNQVRDGDLVVHFNTFSAATLAPEIARQYRIPRAQNYGIVNISVRRGEVASSQPVKAKVTGFGRNLLSQVKDLDFREIEEKGAVYYIASFRFDNEEKIKFDIQVTPEGRDKPIRVTFENQFYTH